MVVNVHRFAADASELGLPPGSFPDTLRPIGEIVGNGLVFIRTFVDYAIGSTGVRSVRYEQANGCLILTVWND